MLPRHDRAPRRHASRPDTCRISHRRDCPQFNPAVSRPSKDYRPTLDGWRAIAIVPQSFRTRGPLEMTSVPAFSVDDLARTHGTPGVLFIDVKGFECEALRGARETLSSAPDLFVEVHI